MLYLLRSRASLSLSHQALASCGHCARRSSSSSSISNPFAILGLSSTPPIEYARVKAAFVKLALIHHPDRNGGSKDEFLKVRHAFESVRELPDGTCCTVETVASGSNDTDDDDGDQLSDWFFHETGQHLSFRMDPAARREVACVASTMAPGGLDRGGMWDMARTIAREEKRNPSPGPRELLSPGDSGGVAAAGSGKRRRKK